MSYLTGWATVSAAAPSPGWCSPGRAASRSPAVWAGAAAPYRSGSAPYCSIQRRTSGAVSDMSTEDARNSSTMRRLVRTRSESVCTIMPGSALREHAGTSVRDFSTSTTHTRHTLTGVRFSR